MAATTSRPPATALSCSSAARTAAVLVAIADIDGDRAKDVLFAIDGTSNMNVVLRAGQSQAVQTAFAYGTVRFGAIGDLNGDRIDDLISVDSEFGVRPLFGSRSGAVTPAPGYWIPR